MKKRIHKYCGLCRSQGLTTGSENRKMADLRPNIQADPEIELFVKVSFLAIVIKDRI